MEPIFENPYMQLTYCGHSTCLRVDWKKFAPSKGFRASLLSLAEALKQQQPRNLIVNAHLLKIIAPEDQPWLSEEWLAKHVGQPSCNIYVLNAEDPFGKMSVKNIISKIQTLHPKLSVEIHPTEASIRAMNPDLPVEA